MILFSAFIIGGISFLIWKTFRLQIIEAMRWVRMGELYLASLLYGDDAVVRYGSGKQIVGVWRKWLPEANVREITNQHIKVMAVVAVTPLRHLFVGILAVLALWAIFYGPGAPYRRRMNLETLMKEQARSFPAIFPFVKFNPRSLPFRAPGQAVPSKLPLFAEALSPEEWMAHNEITMVGGQIDINRAWNALGKQLGRRWQGPQKLPIHIQGLYAACALKHVRKRKDCEALLNEMAKAWTPEKGLELPAKVKKQIRQVIANPKQGGALQKYADMHAYETTALLRCLARARQEGGVMAPAEFLWLRGEDRALWYPLNNLGRKAFHAEAAGAMVHYVNELIAGQKIPTPRFEEVIRGIEAYMKSGAARSIPEIDKVSNGGKYWKKAK